MMATERIPGGGDAMAKCVRCSRGITDADRVVMMHGDLFHRTCWNVLRSEVRRADSRQLAKLSAELIKRSRQKRRGGPNREPSSD